MTSPRASVDERPDLDIASTSEPRLQAHAPAYPPGTVRGLLAGDRVTAPTRDALLGRLAVAPVTEPRFFAADAFETLQTACARLIPQPNRPPPIDLAGGIDARLAAGKGDGWRYAAMPPDGVAFRRGLHGLDETAQVLFGSLFRHLDERCQDEVLGLVQRGEAPEETWRTLPAARFFEEFLAETTESYYAHPLAQEEIGYVGMADAQGWAAIGLNEREAHEPRENAHE